MNQADGRRHGAPSASGSNAEEGPSSSGKCGRCAFSKPELLDPVLQLLLCSLFRGALSLILLVTLLLDR